MKKRNKFNLILIIFVIALVLGLGYAYLTTNLSINGTTDVDANTWNVYWDNVQVTQGSVSASTPVIDTSKTTVTFSIHLSKPGDFYEFTVDAVNAGTIDAMIETINKTTNIPNYLDYSVTYNDSVPVEVNHLLMNNSTEVYKIRVAYKDDISANDLPNSATSLNLSFSLNYIQKNNNAIQRHHSFSGTKYIAANERIYLGDSIVNKETYDTAALAKTKSTEYWVHPTDIPFCFKLTVVDDIVTYVELEMEVTQAMVIVNPGMTAGTYILKPGIENRSVNISTLQTAFGAANCTTNLNDYYCKVGEYDAHSNIYGGNSLGIYNTCACELISEGSDYYCWHE